MLAFSILGSTYVLASVGVTIYQRRHPDERAADDTVSETVTPAEQRRCWDELADVNVALEKHLEGFHHLLGGYEPDEAQRWADQGALWRRQWNALGRRCRFPKIDSRRSRNEMEQMAAAHEELGEIEAQYTRELLRFGREQAPRLDRVQTRIDAIGRRLDEAR